MFDEFRLREALVKYKMDFTTIQWKNEQYKWEAIKVFQDNWDVNATDFADMLSRSLSKTYNLLASANNFPAGMITGFAKIAPEEVRAMFIALFDESADVIERIMAFKNNSSVLLEKYGNGARQHYQYENAISTYLWLRYPDKYYIYKYSEVKTVADELGSDYRFKKGAYTENLRNFYSLYDEICEYIRTDTELTGLLKTQLTDTCYPDPKYKTLTVDVGFYISRYYSQKESTVSQEWFPKDYSPEITTDTWVELLHDSEVFTESSLEIMKRMKDYGGEATCSQLATKYGESANFYNAGSTALARRVAGKTGCPVMSTEDDSIKWWPILYLGRNADKDDEGVFTWKLRDELATALNKIDLSDVQLYSSSKDDLNPCDENFLDVSQNNEKYNKTDFLTDVFMSEQRYDMLAAILKNKKNIILQGAPGVGKTFAAKRLAYSVMGEKNDSCIEFVQFHQNYSYEDFMMGYKPSEDGFELRTGIFYRFCQKAANQPEKDFFFIIDEINRGNMSKIFGELLMLIENDYRGTKTTLAYNGISFSVPANLYIIGMMNTADRSLAMIDYALRRRFSFFEMEPGFDSEGFVRYQNELNNETFNQLIEKIKELNKKIASDRSLGKGFCIGHSYFCNWKECTDEKMKLVVDFDILPMLDEYWFDNPEELQRWSNILHGVFQ